MTRGRPLTLAVAVFALAAAFPPLIGDAGAQDEAGDRVLVATTDAHPPELHHRADQSDQRQEGPGS